MDDKKTEQNINKKHPFTLTKKIVVLLILAVALLSVSIYANLNQAAIGKKIAEKMVSGAASASPSASTLPAELTTLGSDQYLVNKQHKIPDGYALTSAQLASPYLNSSTDVIQLATNAAEPAKNLKKAAADAGITLIVSSGYVTYKEQDDLYTSTVKLLGDGAASTAVEKAGYSEHQLGLAIDFTDDAAKAKATAAFGDTDAGKWLYEHAHEYGFILRYPKGKESVTGYDYMPWHYRYVGVDVANAMYAISPDETLEEYYKVNN